MNADNYVICPECDQKRLKNIENAEKKIRDSYGKIPELEYVGLKAEVARLKSQSRQATLRENCEIGICEGEFEILYTGSCSRCGFSHTFTHHENVS
jgi:hypothetical protein